MQTHRAQPRPAAHSAGPHVARANRHRFARHLVAAGVVASALAATPVRECAAAAFLADAPGASDEVAARESAPATAAPRQRTVFFCREGGVPVFTDRPCESGADPRKLRLDAPAAGAVPSTVPPQPRASTRPRLQPDGQARPDRDTEARCAALKRQLEVLDDRMRTGYSSREAARLWNRWRELKARLRTERC